MKAGTSMEFRDTMELMPMSLARLAKDMGIEHGKSHVSVATHTKNGKKVYKKLDFRSFTEKKWRNNNSLRFKLRAYCQNDVRVLRNVHEKFIQSLKE